MATPIHRNLKADSTAPAAVDRKTAVRSTNLVALLCCVLVSVSSFRVAAQTGAEWTVGLKGGAVFTDLWFVLTSSEGTWRKVVYAYPGTRVAAATESFSGIVKSATVSGSKTVFAISLLASGGWVDYTIEATPSGSSLSGSFTGTYIGMPVSGQVTGTATSLISGHVPVAPNEHPRLLLRKNQLEWLRGKVSSEYGADVVAKARELIKLDQKGFSWTCFYPGSGPTTCGPQYSEGTWAVGHALLWAFFRDKSELERAKRIMISAMVERGTEEGGIHNAQRWLGAAITYDLCYDGWDPEFRRRVVQFLKYFALSPGRTTGARSNSAAGACAMAIAYDSLPLPFSEPPAGPETTRKIAPPSYTPGKGVPVDTINSLVMPKNWLLTGPLAPGTAGEPFQAMGGVKSARPEQGTSISDGGASTAFAPTTDGQTSQKYGQVYKTDVPNPAFDNYSVKCSVTPFAARFCYRYGFLALQVKRGMSVVAWPNRPMHTYGVKMWIGGEEVLDGEVVRLEPGTYPLLVAIPTVGLFASPFLEEYTTPVQQRMTSEWRMASEEASASRSSGYGLRTAEARAEAVRQYVLDQVSASGKPVDHGTYLYTTYGRSNTELFEIMLPWAKIYRNTVGKDFSAGTGLRRLLPPQFSFSTDWLHNWEPLSFPGIAESPVKAAVSDIDNPVCALYALVNYYASEMPRALPTTVKRTLNLRALASGDHPRLYDLRGRVLLRNQEKLDMLRNQPAGVFLTSETGRAVRKLVVR